MGQRGGSTCLPRVFLMLLFSFGCKLLEESTAVWQKLPAVWGQRFRYVHADVKVMFYLAVHGVGQDRHRIFDSSSPGHGRAVLVITPVIKLGKLRFRA